jgi:transcription initiation factor TFIIH subunit 2
MPDSDDEYVEEPSDDDIADHQVTTGGVVSNYGTRSKGRAPRANGKKDRASRKAAWEDIHRSWERVEETEEGHLALSEWLEAEKRRRVLHDTTPLQRGIIRHLMLVLDLSFAMADKDYLPSRYLLTINYSIDFVREFYEQNPISQLGIVGMRDGIAVRISDMSGNPAEHIEKLRELHDKSDPIGNCSFQNALEMCRGVLLYVRDHASMFAALPRAPPLIRPLQSCALPRDARNLADLGRAHVQRSG